MTRYKREKEINPMYGSGSKQLKLYELPDIFHFASDSQDVKAIYEECFNKQESEVLYEEFPACFYRRNNMDDIVEIWGIAGIIPYLEKTVYKLK